MSGFFFKSNLNKSTALENRTEKDKEIDEKFLKFQTIPSGKAALSVHLQ